MRKKFCKLIISISFIIAVFIGSSFNAYADPLTAAMIANQFASAFSFTGLAGMDANSISSVTGDFYVDIVPWTALVTASHAYCTVRDLIGSNNVEIELSPEISNAGYDRNVQFIQHYGANPGTIVNLGSYYRYGGYVFDRAVIISGYTWYKGPTVGITTSSIGDTGSFGVGACTWAYVVNRTGPTGTSYTSTIGAASPYDGTMITVPTPICLAFAPTLDNGRIGFVDSNSQSRYGTKTLDASGISIASPVQSSVERPVDSSVINPGTKSNLITIPASYLNDVSYSSGVTIDQEEVVRLILDKISEAITSGDAISSEYVDPSPSPTPVPGQTVSETPWTSFNTWFDNYFSGWTEVFGDIYDGISDFQESFGDWVDDVASGWTEVFGDIYDTLSGWTEVFGDIYDGIIDGFGDIAGTLEGIYDYVADIVQEIVNADANWVNGFINNFLSQFQDWFDALKQHVSIWHYVVEWLASIRSVFTFFFGVMSNTGYNFVLPIYACFAGTVVIAIYRRFGK